TLFRQEFCKAQRSSSSKGKAGSRRAPLPLRRGEVSRGGPRPHGRCLLRTARARECEPGTPTGLHQHAVRSTVDGRHAAIAVDAKRLPHLAVAPALDQIGLAQERATHGHERKALIKRTTHRLDPVDAAEENERHPECGAELPCVGQEEGLLERIGSEKAAGRELEPETQRWRKGL